MKSMVLIFVGLIIVFFSFDRIYIECYLCK